MTERFKPNDPTELQVINVMLPTLEALGTDRDMFMTGAFQCFLLGDILYDLGRDPLAGAITKEVFRTAYPAIHELFTRPGTFEFYLSVFRAIFVTDTTITFTIPDPGQLTITIDALVYQTFNISLREIVSDAYVYSDLVTSDTNDKILVQGQFGIKTQAEMDALLPEISACGVYTQINLVFV